MRALLLTCFTLATTGCSTGAWNQAVPASPLLGIDGDGIWRFPTPGAAPSSSAEPTKGGTRAPKPYARRTVEHETL